jgi:hypothetical protein
MKELGKVVSISDRLEKWSTSYTSPDGDLQIKTSSHGRIMIMSGNTGPKPVALDFFESVRMLSRVSEDMEFVLKTE